MLTKVSIEEMVRNGVPAKARDPQVYQRMAPKLRRLARRMAKYLEEGGGSLPALCRAGAECLKVIIDDDSYGDSAHAHLAACLGVSELALMAARDVAVACSGSELDALTSRRTPQGGWFTLPQLAILAHVESEGDRRALAERALDAETSPESLCECASSVPGDHFMQRTFCRRLNPAFKEDEADAASSVAAWKDFEASMRKLGLPPSERWQPQNG